MKTILRVDASARTTRSLSRMLGDRFLDRWKAVDPGVEILYRDVGTTPPPFVSEAWIAAAFKDPATRTAADRAVLAVSDTLIDELERADVVVIATPMYNYGMPAQLKAWFDQVVRIGRTFTFDLARGDRPLRPELTGKTLVTLTSWGEFGFGPGGPNAGHEHLTPHLATVSKYLGASEIHHIGIEYQEFGDDRHAASKRQALAAVPELADRLVGRAGAAAAERPRSA